MIESGRTALEAQLTQRLREPAPGRVQLLVGPRQVGKTTLLLELARRHGWERHYHPCDAPPASLAGFWERAWAAVREEAVRTGKAAIFLDEVHHLPDWASRLKAEWDRLQREGAPVHVVASGSAALRLTWGSKESLAGRFERLVLGHWSARDLAGAFALPEEEAALEIVRRGAYPGAFPLREDPNRWTAYVRDAIVEPAIARDLVAGTLIRKPALLRQVFALAVASPARIVSLQKIRGALEDAGALETVAAYLELLEEAYLVASLPKWSREPARRRAAPPKLLPLSNAFLAATDPGGIPAAERDPARWGAWVENACLAFAWSQGQRVTYWRAEPHEVDAVLEGSWGRLALEVKTGPFATAELRGVLEFCRLHPDFRPLVVVDERGIDVARQAGVDAIHWRRFLSSGP
ncbi:MAG TPA: AAA family ATPase [Candidatus Polarisedimenticolaceae bacterium]|nr:AAA family ATPase [Candidatus Polarisedimenticolaceae bacterium]